MNIDKQTFLKYLSLGALGVFVFLLINLQVLLAVIVLIVAAVSWIMGNKNEGA